MNYTASCIKFFGTSADLRCFVDLVGPDAFACAWPAPRTDEKVLLLAGVRGTLPPSLVRDFERRLGAEVVPQPIVTAPVFSVLRSGWLTPLEPHRSAWEGRKLVPRVKLCKRMVETRYTDFVCEGFLRMIWQAHKHETGDWVVQTCHERHCGLTSEVVMKLRPTLYYRRTCVQLKRKFPLKSRRSNATHDQQRNTPDACRFSEG